MSAGSCLKAFEPPSSDTQKCLCHSRERTEGGGVVFIKILHTFKTAGGNFWGHLLGNHCKVSPWHCCSWQIGVVPLLLGHPVTHGLPCWFNGGVSTSLGCKWATGGEFFLLCCHMKPVIFLTALCRKTVPASFVTATGGRGQSSCPRYPKTRVDCAD